MRYKAASITADVEVQSYAEVSDRAISTYGDSFGARRNVKLHFAESFTDDSELDAALEAFAASVRAAATR